MTGGQSTGGVQDTGDRARLAPDAAPAPSP
jgi:hypothetical protein